MTEISYISEIKRKIFHLLILVLPISYFYLGKKHFLLFLLPISAILITLDYYRHQIDSIKNKFDFIFGRIIRKHEEEKLTGASYMLISACIIFTFFPGNIAITSFAILAISDSLAALIGRGIKSPKFYEKSLAGSLAFFLSAAVIFIYSGIYFNQGFFYYLFGSIAVLIITMIEARPSFVDLDDNLTIPLGFALITHGFEFFWVYYY